MTEIADRVALVTGGQRGLGAAIVQGLLDRGAARVYATARAPRPEQDPRIVPLALDVVDDASVAGLAEQVGDVDIVVNNAGVMVPTPLLRVAVDEVRATFETNVFGALRITQAFAPVLASRGGGAFVNLHSLLSWGAGGGAYGASKAALWSLSNSLRLELEAQGTHVLGVHLGFADTDMVAQLPAPQKLSPRHVADVVLDALGNGEPEVLVDDATRAIKDALSGPVRGLTVRLAR